MFHILAHLLDSGQRVGLLHPSGYPGSSYHDVLARLAAVYAVPFVGAVALALGAKLLMRR